MQRSLSSRLAALERLERFWHDDDDERPVEQWSDEELAAYLEEAYRTWPRLRTMSDAELEALYVKEFS